MWNDDIGEFGWSADVPANVIPKDDSSEALDGISLLVVSEHCPYQVDIELY
jgi:hypothetical protein